MNTYYPSLRGGTAAIARRVWVFAIVALMACSPAGAPSAPSATSAGAAVASPASSAPRSDSAPTPPPNRDSTAAAIKVGMLLSQTGGFAAAAADHLDGFNLYVQRKGGSLSGRRVDVVVADDGLRPDGAVTKARQLVESDRVDVILGPAFSPICNALAPYIKQAQVPLLISLSCPNQTLFTDPQLKTPYVMRSTWRASQVVDVAADWMYKNGLRRAVVAVPDIIGGLEISDAFSSAFVKRGGSIVQEFYPSSGTADFAPLLTSLSPDADTVMIGLPFADALRFAQQYPDYAPDRKLQMTSVGGGATTPVNVAQLKDKVVGYVGFEAYCTCIPSQMNQDFIQQWTSAYPGRAVTADAAQGYSAAQILEAALSKVEATGQNTQALLDALHATNLETVKGPISFDADGDVVQNVYVYKVIKTSSGVDYQLIETYPSLTPGWDRSAQELATFPFGKLKGKWVGMTAEELAKIAAP